MSTAHEIQAKDDKCGLSLLAIKRFSTALFEETKRPSGLFDALMGQEARRQRIAQMEAHTVKGEMAEALAIALTL
jgi:hypothetical protein